MYVRLDCVSNKIPQKCHRSDSCNWRDRPITKEPSVNEHETIDVTPNHIEKQMSHSLVLPMTSHFLLSALLYVLLTVARAPKIWGIGKRADGSNPWAAFEPRISANLSNQFEWPLFFHVACLLFIVSGSSNSAVIAFSWIFVAGRIVHSLVQILTTNVRLRGLVFTINFMAVMGMWMVLGLPLGFK